MSRTSSSVFFDITRRILADETALVPSTWTIMTQARRPLRSTPLSRWTSASGPSTWRPARSPIVARRMSYRTFGLAPTT